MPDELRMEPPPRLELLPQPPPVLIPPLRELPKFPGPIPDEITPFASDPVADPLAERREAIRERVFAHERVQRLQEGRFVEIGAALRGKPEADERRTVVHVVWDHAARAAVQTTLDADTLEILDVTESTDQPAPTSEEIEQAVAMAARSERLPREVEGLVGLALLISPIDPEDPLFGHRVFDVRFFSPDERLPRAAALVDLTDERVLRVGDPRAAEQPHERGGEH